MSETQTEDMNAPILDYRKIKKKLGGTFLIRRHEFKPRGKFILPELYNKMESLKRNVGTVLRVPEELRAYFEKNGTSGMVLTFEDVRAVVNLLNINVGDVVTYGSNAREGALVFCDMRDDPDTAMIVEVAAGDIGTTVELDKEQ